MQRIVRSGGAVISRREVIRAPFPDIAGYVVQSISVWFESMNGSGSGMTILGRVTIGKAALPDVAAMLTPGH